LIFVACMASSQIKTVPMQFLKPAVYFPLEKGVYEVAPMLNPFGKDFGNGSLDQKVFQIDSDFEKFKSNKNQFRSPELSKYVARKNFDPTVEYAATDFVLQRLVSEWPQYFQATEDNHCRTLTCLHTDETLRFNSKLQIMDSHYESLLDALMNQVPEDCAVIRQTADTNWVSYLNVFSPSHWAPNEKIGLDFSAVHLPVPGIEKMNKVSNQIVNAMIHKGPYVRFVWSIVTDTRLNRHLHPPSGTPPEQWKGRSLNLSQSDNPFWLRIERQITWGLPTAEAALFFIKVSFLDTLSLRQDQYRCEKLKSMLHSVPAESHYYKGMGNYYADLIKFLEWKN
jgi:hypothetical protein